MLFTTLNVFSATLHFMIWKFVNAFEESKMFNQCNFGNMTTVIFLCRRCLISTSIDKNHVYMSFNLHYVKYWSHVMLLSAYIVSALPKAKCKVKFSPLNGSKLSSGLFSGFYEGIFHWLTGTAEQGNPSLHGLVGMTDANMLLLSPDTDTIITLTQLQKGKERERQRERERERERDRETQRERERERERERQRERGVPSHLWLTFIFVTPHVFKQFPRLLMLWSMLGSSMMWEGGRDIFQVLSDRTVFWTRKKERAASDNLW